MSWCRSRSSLRPSCGNRDCHRWICRQWYRWICQWQWQRQRHYRVLYAIISQGVIIFTTNASWNSSTWKVTLETHKPRLAVRVKIAVSFAMTERTELWRRTPSPVKDRFRVERQRRRLWLRSWRNSRRGRRSTWRLCIGINNAIVSQGSIEFSTKTTRNTLEKVVSLKAHQAWTTVIIDIAVPFTSAQNILRRPTQVINWDRITGWGWYNHNWGIGWDVNGGGGSDCWNSWAFCRRRNWCRRFCWKYAIVG